MPDTSWWWGKIGSPNFRHPSHLCEWVFLHQETSSLPFHTNLCPTHSVRQSVSKSGKSVKSVSESSFERRKSGKDRKFDKEELWHCLLWQLTWFSLMRNGDRTNSHSLSFSPLICSTSSALFVPRLEVPRKHWLSFRQTISSYVIYSSHEKVKRPRRILFFFLFWANFQSLGHGLLIHFGPIYRLAAESSLEPRVSFFATRILFAIGESFTELHSHECWYFFLWKRVMPNLSVIGSLRL